MTELSEYIGPSVSVDTVAFQLIENELYVLLIKRAQQPFKGMWALPGGYNPVGETTHEAMARVLQAKAGIKVSQLSYVEQLYTFDTVARDPRGHAISITYMGLGKNLVPKASKTTENPQFFPVSELPALAYDHAEIIKYAHERLISKLSYTNAVCSLLPKMFTLSQLQLAYEAVLGRQLDKRNFRKKFLSLSLIQPTTEFHMEGAHRPAKLYRFNAPKIEYLSRSFE